MQKDTENNMRDDEASELDYGGLERAFVEAADALQAQLAYAKHERSLGAEPAMIELEGR